MKNVTEVDIEYILSECEGGRAKIEKEKREVGQGC